MFQVAEALQLFDAVTAQKNEAHKKIAEITGMYLWFYWSGAIKLEVE